MKDLDRDAFNTLLDGVGIDLPEKSQAKATTGFDTAGQPLDDDTITKLAQNKDEFWTAKKNQVTKLLEDGLSSAAALPQTAMVIWYDDEKGMSFSAYNLNVPNMVFQLELIKNSLLRRMTNGQ